MRGHRRAPSSRPAPGQRFGPDGAGPPRRYWDPVTEALAAQERPPADLAAVVEESVDAHLVSDVPVASFLSGGLDSSLVTAIAASRDPGIEAYTITFRPEDQRLEAMPDDAVHARAMAAHLGIRLHEIEISPDVVDLLPHVVDTLDEPIGDPAAINTVLMCQAARDAGVKVLLSGMGADELFGGYRKHLACLMGARYRRLPSAVRSGLVAPAVGHLPVAAFGRGLRYSRWAKRFLSFAELPEEAAFRRSYTHVRPGGSRLAARPGARRPCRRRPRRPPPSTPVATGGGPRHRRTTSTACASPTRGCSCPA